MPIIRKLIVEHPCYDVEPLMERKNLDQEPRYYFTGQYLMLSRKNKNNRIYEESEMLPAIDRYIADYVKHNRGGGECNHSLEPEMKLDRLAHKIVELKRDTSEPDFYIGKSEILTENPPGKILAGLIKHNVNWGLSSKCLGQIEESERGNLVKSPIILGVDAVWDASANTKFINGIYEEREWIIGDDQKVYEAFQGFSKAHTNYISKHRSEVNAHIIEQLSKFLKSL